LSDHSAHQLRGRCANDEGYWIAHMPYFSLETCLTPELISKKSTVYVARRQLEDGSGFPSISDGGLETTMIDRTRLSAFNLA
jgi:hypothetical protein